jgi:hypothetical protein
MFPNGKGDFSTFKGRMAGFDEVILWVSFLIHLIPLNLVAKR